MSIKKLGSTKLTDDVLVSSVNLASEVTGILSVANGGTGQSVFTNGQLLIGNTTGNTLTKATLTAGSGISITNGAGSISIAATAVSSQWVTNGSDIYYTAGAVGIGITSPSVYSSLNIDSAKKLLVRSSSNNWGQFQVANPTDGESTIAIAANGTGSPGNDSTYTRQWVMGINPYSVGQGVFAITNKTLQGTNPALALTEAGDVGMGTASPEVLANYRFLTVSGSTGGGIVCRQGANGRLSIYNANSDGYYDVTADHVFRTGSILGGTERVRVVNTSGNALQVSGSIATIGGVGRYIKSAGWISNNVGSESDFGSFDVGVVAKSGGILSFITHNGTSATEKVRLTNVGHVGIGNTDAYSSLTVTGTNQSWGEGITVYPAPNGYGGLVFRLVGNTGSTTTGSWALSKETNSGAGSEAFSILKNGLTGSPLYRGDALQTWKPNGDAVFGFNVGIGTTTPYSLLTLNNGDAWINVNATLRGLQFGYAGPAHGSYRAAVMGGAESYGATDSGMLTFHTQSGYVVSAIPPERMRITSTGNVGIGTTNPGANLQVNRTGAGIAGYIYQTDSNQSYLNFGNATTGLYSQNFATVGGLLIGIDTDESAILWHGSNYALRFGTNSAERMRLSADGNFGVGATNPQARLHITGANITNGSVWLATDKGSVVSHVHYGTTADWYIRSGLTTGNVIIQDTGGNVGIGNGSPAVLLDLKRAVSAGVLMRVQNDAAAGYSAIQFFNSGGSVTGHVGYGNASVGNTSLANAAFFGTISANDAVITTSDAVRVTVKSGGNVGIRNTNPAYSLVVNKQSAAAPAIMAGGAFFGGPRIQTYGLDADPNAWMGLGTDMGGNPYEHSIYYSDTGSLGVLTFGTYNGTTFTERARLTRLGSFLVGITGGIESEAVGVYKVGLNAFAAKVSNNAFWNYVGQNTSGTRTFTVTGAGDVTANDFILSSDRRRKTDLVRISDALTKVLAWAGYTYRPIDGERRRAGLMAQDVEVNAPELVHTDKDGWKSMSYEQAIPYLVEAIRDLHRMVEALS